MDFNAPIGIEPQPMDLNLGGPAAPGPSTPPVPSGLSGPQKAAIIVRMLAGDEMPITLHDLPEDMQIDLVKQIGSVGQLDPSTLESVVEEFIQLLEGGGVWSSLDIGGALDMLGNAISPEVSELLRTQPGGRPKVIDDPWTKIAAHDTDELLEIVNAESIEVAAVVLSKLKVNKAAELLGKMPGARARRITYAVSLTSAVHPAAVRRIGQAIAAEMEVERAAAFSETPVERVGAILNFSRAQTRDEMLDALTETDSAFAAEVRKAIFTFGNITERVSKSDVPKIIRQVDQDVMITALAAALAGDQAEVAEFLLGNISKRMADGFRGEVEDKGEVSEDDGEEAMTAVVAAIRELEAAGEIYLIMGD